jgi:hypothetical protein
VLDPLAAAAEHALDRPEVQARVPDLRIDPASHLGRWDFARHVTKRRVLMTRLAAEADIPPE